jgi:hypothetical protein
MSVGYFLSNLVGHLPLLAVLAAGFVLVSARRRSVGARSAGLARAGLAALAVTVVLQIAWAMTIPALMDGLDSTTRFGIASFVIGMFLAVFFAAGVALILAALLTRTPAGPLPFGPGEGPQPAQSHVPGRPYAPNGDT